MMKQQLPDQHHSDNVLPTSTNHATSLRKISSEQTHGSNTLKFFKKSKSKKQEVIERLDHELERINSDKELMMVRVDRKEKEMNELKQIIAVQNRSFSSATSQLEGVNNNLNETLQSLHIAISPESPFPGNDQPCNISSNDKMYSLIKASEILADKLNATSQALIRKTKEAQQESERMEEENAAQRQAIEQNMKLVKDDRDVLLKKVIDLSNQVDEMSVEITKNNKVIGDLQAWKTHTRKAIHEAVIKMKKSYWFF